MNEVVLVTVAFIVGIGVMGVVMLVYLHGGFQKAGVVKQATKEIEHSDDYEVVQVGDSWLFMIRDVGCVSTSGSTAFNMPHFIQQHCLFDSQSKAVRVGMKYYQVRKALHSFNKGK